MHRSSSSASPTPTITFASNWSIATKSSLSPPSTTASTDSFSLSPSISSPRSPFGPSSPGNAFCAYPSWPNRASLSPSVVDSNSHECADSRISDDDLISLDGWLLRDDDGCLSAPGYEIQEQEISWSRTVQPPFGASIPRKEPRRLAPAPVERRRIRSSPSKRRAESRTMNTIAE